MAGGPTENDPTLFVPYTLLGGSPAAAVAMFVLRHKTSKPSFLARFAVVVAAQVFALAVWWSWRG